MKTLLTFNQKNSVMITSVLLYFSPAQVVKIFIALAVFCTYGLQWFVCLEIIWNGLKDRFQKKALLAEYIVRVILVAASGT